MKEESIKTKAVRLITVVLLVAVVVGGLRLLWPKLDQARVSKRQSAALDEKIAEKERQISELKDKQQRFRSDPDFVEQVARQNSRVYPGELVFVFEKEK